MTSSEILLIIQIGICIGMFLVQIAHKNFQAMGGWMCAMVATIEALVLYRYVP